VSKPTNVAYEYAHDLHQKGLLDLVGSARTARVIEPSSQPLQLSSQPLNTIKSLLTAIKNLATITQPIRPTYRNRQRVKPLPSPACAINHKECEESLHRAGAPPGKNWGVQVSVSKADLNLPEPGLGTPEVQGKYYTHEEMYGSVSVTQGFPYISNAVTHPRYMFSSTKYMAFSGICVHE
jgi:hypothetical protein